MMRKSILQLVSLEPLFVGAGDVNAEETNLVFNMTDDAPQSSTTLPDDPEIFEDREVESSSDSGHQLRSHFSH